MLLLGMGACGWHYWEPEMAPPVVADVVLWNTAVV